jgi:MarC family membrane protein
MDTLTNILSLSFSLFVLMDPLGNIPIFLAVLKETPAKRQRAIIFRELVLALIIIVMFYFVGDWILNAFHVTNDAVLISGGIILFLVALKMIFPAAKDSETNLAEKEPFLVPLAVPFVAGPAVLAVVMLYSHQSVGHVTVLSAIGIAWVFSTLILMASASLKKLLGSRGLTACERLMGLIITLIAVQMFLEGLKLFLHRGPA